MSDNDNPTISLVSDTQKTSSIPQQLPESFIISKTIARKTV